MVILENLSAHPIPQPVVCIGSFDGVHLGHKKIISTLNDQAKKMGGKSVVITFFPPPRKILNPSSPVKYLTLLDEKILLLEKLGIDYLIIEKFTKTFSQKSPQDFVVNFLVHKLQIKCFVLGHDSRFGHNKVGSYETLLSLSKPYNFKLIKVDELQSEENLPINSTAIRKLIAEGKVEAANRFLGYAFRVNGEVISGNEKGKMLSFPTANIRVNEDKLLPANGVYAVKVLYKNIAYSGMLNIGYRPTVSTQNYLSIEVHIFDFNENIYGKKLQLQFYSRVRDEKKFRNIDELKAQLQKDKKNIAAYFNLAKKLP